MSCAPRGVSGYEPLRKRRRERLEELRTGDGRPLPVGLHRCLALIGGFVWVLTITHPGVGTLTTARARVLDRHNDGKLWDQVAAVAHANVDGAKSCRWDLPHFFSRKPLGLIQAW